MIRIVALIILIATSGCGGGGAKIEQVSGTITIDGSPLEGAEVKLVSANGSGFAKTGVGGKYQLVRGVPPGKYKVVISKFEGGPKPEAVVPKKGEEQLDAGQYEAIAMAEQSDPGRTQKSAAAAGKEVIPADYSSLTSTKLELDVPRGGINDANFQITSK